MVQRMITGEKEELEAMLEQNKGKIVHIGTLRGVFDGGLLSRLLFGNPEYRARRSVLKPARESGANLVVFSSGCYSGDWYGRHGANDYHLWADLYKIIPDAPQADSTPRQSDN